MWFYVLSGCVDAHLLCLVPMFSCGLCFSTSVAVRLLYVSVHNMLSPSCGVPFSFPS